MPSRPLPAGTTPSEALYHPLARQLAGVIPACPIQRDIRSDAAPTGCLDAGALLLVTAPLRVASIIPATMRSFAIAFLVVFATGFGTALAFYELGAAAGIGAAVASIVMILLMSVVGDAIANPARGHENLGEGAHYQVWDGVRYAGGFSDFFRALAEIAPPESYLALAGGAWDKEIRDAITNATAHLDDLPELPRNFHAPGNTDEGVLPINESTMDVFAKLADHHASPEIAGHLGAFTNDGTWLEWFDATDDPISISLSIPEEAVQRFATRVQGKWLACRWTDPRASAVDPASQ